MIGSSESGLWKHVRYVRPSRRHDPKIRQLMEDTVSVHKRAAALRLRHCQGCGCFLASASLMDRCPPCAKRERRGSTMHWWTGLRGREKWLQRPAD